MLAIKKACKLIEASPESAAANALSSLIIALESENEFALNAIYKLPLPEFELAMDILKEWRLDRYYMSKARLIDSSLQVQQLASLGSA